MNHRYGLDLNELNQDLRDRDTVLSRPVRLYLADTDAQRKRLWDRVHKAMLNLKLPPDLIDHIMARRDVEILAKNLQDWLRAASTKRS